MSGFNDLVELTRRGMAVSSYRRPYFNQNRDDYSHEEKGTKRLDESFLFFDEKKRPIPDDEKRRRKLPSSPRNRLPQPKRMMMWSDKSKSPPFVEVWVGLPPQKLALKISTLSRFSVFPCVSAVVNTDFKHAFRTEASSSFQKPACNQCTLAPITGMDVACDESRNGANACLVQIR